MTTLHDGNEADVAMINDEPHEAAEDPESAVRQQDGPTSRLRELTINETRRDIEENNKEDSQTTQRQEKPNHENLEPRVDKPFSVFTPRERWLIVIFAAAGGLLSPLTANIYFPAITTIANAFNTSVELINLTVTIYMVMQGLSPMIWGTLADKVGRRPIFLACLLVLSLSCVGLALVPTNAYWLLMLLRAVQAAGSASTVALGAGVIGDIATPAERGGYFGIYNIGPMVGPCLGPIVGGALAGSLGWRAIFWFMCIVSAACFVFLLLVLPETLRALVGDGSYVPSKLYRPIIPIIGRNRRCASSTERPPKKKFVNPLRLFTRPEVVLVLLYNGLVYAVLYGFSTPMSDLFTTTYPYLNETDIGLCFLGIGGGMLLASTVTGTALDKDYQAVKRSFMKKMATEGELENGSRKEGVSKSEDFPIEKSRLRWMPLANLMLVVICCGYGWCLERKVSLAAPLVLQVGVGFIVNGMMIATQTVLVDLAPSQGSSITACNNVVRCLMGAGLVSVVDIIIRAIGTGWTYVIFGGIVLLSTPLLYLVMGMGTRWRARRNAKERSRR